MRDSTLTIVIPVKKPLHIERFISENLDYLNKYRVIVIDSGGGEKLSGVATIYLNQNLSLSEARKIGINMVTSPFILNLDSDTILPKNYLNDAFCLLKIEENKVVALDYEISQGHYAFGTSIWKTNILKKLYNYQEKSPLCECVYMWRRLIGESKFKLETLPYRANHLKGDN
jgi:glycosyltransferase involved in cell wall biosynthesis